MRPKHWVIVAVVVAGICVVAVVAAWFLFFAPRMTTPVRADLLQPGDCVRTYETDVLEPVVNRVRCNGPHHGEVYATLPAPQSPDYPGGEALERLGDQCGGKLFDYAPNLPEGPTFRLAVGYPNAEAWSDGARSVVCVAMSANERWESFRG